MKGNKESKKMGHTCYILTYLVSFVLIIKFKNFECDVEYDIAMAIFGSSILGCIMSFTEYFSERERAMEQFYQEAIRTLAKFSQGLNHFN